MIELPPAMRATLTSFRRYSETCLYVRTKNRQLVQFKWNPVQVAYWAAKQRARDQGKPRRYLVLKYRQGGITTIEQAKSFYATASAPYVYAVTLAHDKDSTEKIFEMSTRFYERHAVPELLPQRAAVNKKELRYPGLDSVFFIGTAGSTNIGHGFTVQRFHGSEAARWPDLNETLTGMGQAVPAGGEIVLETTANGVGEPFHVMWEEAKAGQNEYTPIFLPWYIDPQYQIPLAPGESLEPYDDEEIGLIAQHRLKPEQIKWRRLKKREPGMRQKFREQYPEDDASCFLASGGCYFTVEKVEALYPGCRDPIRTEEGGALLVWEEPMPGKTYSIGADVAEGLEGGDYSAFVVLDQHGNECAAYRGHIDDVGFANLLYKWGQFYNLALIAVERNNHGHSVINTLFKQLHYPTAYYMAEYGDRDDKAQRELKKLGWLTNAKTKPIIVNGLAALIDGDCLNTRDRRLVGELRTYIRHSDGSIGARPGCFDDLVMARAIATEVNGSATLDLSDFTSHGRRASADMDEGGDYEERGNRRIQFD